METNHVCMKTYYVRTRTGEIRPITTKAFICPKLGTDLLSVKSLNLGNQHFFSENRKFLRNSQKNAKILRNSENISENLKIFQKI